MNRPDSRWSDASRIEAWAGEVRVNLIRLIAIVLFYGRHLVDYFAGPVDSPARGQYHVVVTALALLWAVEAVALHVWLSRRIVADWLKYAAVLWDLLMITMICAATRTAQTPLVLLYFAVIASAPLRLSLGLVYFATAASMAAYLVLLAHYAWYVVGFEKYYATPELRIPRSTEAMTLLALLVCGLLAGQVVRQAKRLAAGYPVRVASEPEAPTSESPAKGDA